MTPVPQSRKKTGNTRTAYLREVVSSTVVFNSKHAGVGNDGLQLFGNNPVQFAAL